MIGPRVSPANRARTCGECQAVPEDFTHAVCPKSGKAQLIVTPGTKGCAWGPRRLPLKPSQGAML